MKQELREFLTTDLQFIKGVGPVLAARFSDLLGGRMVLDFLLHRPSYVRPREILDGLDNAVAGEVITILIQVISVKKGGIFRSGHRAPTAITCKDKFGATLTLQFFSSSFLNYWLDKLPIDEWRLVSGKLDITNRGAAINHPDFIELPENIARIPEFQPIYPCGEGLTQKVMANVRDGIFESLRLKAEDNEFIQLLEKIHYPQSKDDLLPNAEVIAKLAYYELLAHQIAIAKTRARRKVGIAGRAFSYGPSRLREKLYASLPFKLTGAQKSAIKEIESDMIRPEPMMRLVQGDVGSGKTIVALSAMLFAAESGAQSVLLAPTDALAQQHFAKIKPFCDGMGIVCDILTGRDKGGPRKEKLLSLRSGRTKIAIGTHALFQNDVSYKDLGLIIIDEQHRFGVAQREAMRAKGRQPDLLALSATPIPRTLSMTIYGDMDISIINEKPAGRLPIKTSKLPIARAYALVERLKLQTASGAKVFWVCPLVEESETSDMMNVQKRFDFLKRYFRAELVHGQMKKEERDKAMEKFAFGDAQVLVATSVIEVGIDVSSATIMVIENAERFGLSALHQLRGRVGRGSVQSYCILMFGNKITEDGVKRLDVLCETEDGFLIAEQDLMMRGIGELLGTKQSGWLQYHFVDYREHRDLFKLAARDAIEMSNKELSEPTKDLLFIFGKESGFKS